MSTALDFTKKTLAIVTGASQGIGRTIAVEMGRKLIAKSKIVLIARSEKGLIETKQLIFNVNSGVLVEIFPMDLSKPNINDYELMFDKFLQDEEIHDIGVIFHNAGQVGTLNVTTELGDLQSWRSYFDLNLFSVALLNSVFIKRMKVSTKQLFVVNISSLCGRKPFVNMALYGSAKAARDLFFSVLAIEEPEVKVLLYSPGPVDTAMFNSIIDDAPSEDVRKQFKEVKETVVLSPDQTVKKMFMLLEKGQFKSGDCVDYFDA